MLYPVRKVDKNASHSIALCGYKPTKNVWLSYKYNTYRHYIHIFYSSRWGALLIKKHLHSFGYIHTQTAFMYISMSFSNEPSIHTPSENRIHPPRIKWQLACRPSLGCCCCCCCVRVCVFFSFYFSISPYTFSVENAFSVYGKFEFAVRCCYGRK